MRAFHLAALILPASLALAACQPETEDTVSNKRPPADACGAARYQSLVGQPADPAAFSDAKSLRIVGPGQPVTMDYRLDRLNVETGEDGTIRRIYCG